MSHSTAISLSTTSPTLARFTSSSVSSPCPVCGRTKDTDCRTKGRLVFCHTQQDGKRGEENNGYRFLCRSDRGAGWGIWIPAEDFIEKKPKPAQERTFTYRCQGGEVRVKRNDSGNGSKQIQQQFWDGRRKQGKIPDEAKRSVEVYRQGELLEALEHGETAFWVEGESTANALWSIGIAATTSIGGCKGYGKEAIDVDLLKPYSNQLVICPDMDTNGVQYAKEVSSKLDISKWCLARPDSYLWSHPIGGYDLEDWIADGANKEDVLEAIVGEMPDVLREDKVMPLKEGKTALTLDQTSAAIRDLIAENLKPSELQAQRIELRSKTTLPEREFESLWKVLAEEFEEEGDRENVREQVELLLQAKRSAIELSSVLPPAIAEPLNQIAQWQCLKPEVYLVTLLTVLGSLARNGTELTLHHSMDFHVTPNIFGLIVAESSQKKSPVIKTIAQSPLRMMMHDAKADYEKAHQEWEEERKAAQDEPFNKPEPQLKIHFFSRATGEAILNQAQRSPETGLLALTDEIAGYFKGANQYRKGAGSDLEDLLEYYDGSGGTVLRAAGLRNDVERLNFGVLGAIQPKIIQRFMGNCEDSNGNWARFFFIQQPTQASILPDEAHNFDLVRQLYETYKQVHDFPARSYHLTHPAFKFFQQCYNSLEQMRVAEPNPALRAAIGKTPGRIGKIALILHLLEAAVDGRQPTAYVELETVKKAADLAKLAIDQIRALYGEFDGNELPNYLAKIIDLSRKKGIVKAKDVQLSITKKHRPDPATVRQWFIQLAEMGMGELDGAGRNLSFQAYPDEKVDAGRREVDKLSTTESFDIKASHQKVDKVDDFEKKSTKPTGSIQVEGGKEEDGDNLPTLSTLSTNSQNLVAAAVPAVDSLSTCSSTASTVSPPAANDCPSPYPNRIRFKVGDRVRKTTALPNRPVYATVTEIDEDGVIGLRYESDSTTVRWESPHYWVSSG